MDIAYVSDLVSRSFDYSKCGFMIKRTDIFSETNFIAIKNVCLQMQGRPDGVPGTFLKALLAFTVAPCSYARHVSMGYLVHVKNIGFVSMYVETKWAVWPPKNIVPTYCSTLYNDKI